MGTRAYRRWLVRTYLQDSEGLPDGYGLLIEQMFRKEYYYFVDYDENRAEDGIYLRARYLDTEGGSQGVVPEGPCSFLEFLIGVSIRLEEMLFDGEQIPIHEYFWELASRLRLTEYNDDAYGYSDTQFVVDAIMTSFMDRCYSATGEGGLFPLHPPCEIQNRVEVWYQLNAYLLQHPNFFRDREPRRGRRRR
jgi:hypothetical protein